MKFDGANDNETGDYVNLNQTINPSTKNAFTFEVWISFDNNEFIGTVLNQRESSNCWLELEANTGIIYSKLSGEKLSNNEIIYWNMLTHCAVTYDGDSIRLFINGLVKDTKRAEKLIDYDGDLLIGWDGLNTNTHFNGWIDELRIWDVCRSESEIRNNMCKTLNGNEEGLLAYYNFDNTSGTILQDFSGNAHDGTIHNMESPDDNWVKSKAFNTWLNTTNTSFTTDENWSEGLPHEYQNIGITNYPGENQQKL